ncbi:MAG: TonB-dependent receptor, partial [Flavobacteriales bacterium]|nr:TonB-dependent receptor [Flavobacteriales bacterium]
SYTFNGRDTIDYDGTPSRVTALTNQAKAYLYGGSANLKARFGKYLSLTSSLTYTYGRVRTDSTEVPLDHIPPIYGRTALVLNVKRLRGEFYVLYNGWKHLADYSDSGEDNLAQATANGMPPWYTLNVRAAVACTKNLSIQLALENIEDRNYRTFASGVSAPGLNVQGSVRVVF